MDPMRAAIAKFMELRHFHAKNAVRQAELKERLTEAKADIREALGDREEWVGDGVRVFIDGSHHVQIHQV